jgi:hypothetical protein
MAFFVSPLASNSAIVFVLITGMLFVFLSVYSGTSLLFWTKIGILAKWRRKRRSFYSELSHGVIKIKVHFYLESGRFLLMIVAW